MRFARFMPMLVVISTMATSVSSTDSLHIAAGPEEGTYRILAGAIHDVLRTSKADIALEILTTQGSVENMELLRDNVADLALVQSDVLANTSRETSQSEGTTAEKLPWRVMLVLSREPVQVVLRPEVAGTRVATLRGRKLFLGLPDSGTLYTAKHILKSLDVADYLTPRASDQADPVRMLEDATVDAAFFVNHPPSRQISSLLSVQGFRLLSFPAADVKNLRQASPFYERYAIGPGTYPLQKRKINTVSVSTVLVCRRDMPRSAAARICYVLIMDASGPGSLLRRSQASVRLADVLRRMDSPFVLVHDGASDALKRVPWRVRAQGHLQWLTWGTVLAFAAVAFFLSCSRISRVRVLYFFINHAPTLIRRTLKTASLHGITWRISGALSALAFIWLWAAAVMYRCEEYTSEAFSSLRQASLSILLYLFSGAEGRIPVSTWGWAVFIVMLITGAVVGAYVTGEFASGIIRRTIGGYKMNRNIAKHSILIVGWNSGADRVIDEFLKSFESGVEERSITVLAPKDVDEALKSEYLGQGVTFLSGSCVDKRTLNHVGAPRCQSVVVLADENVADPDAQTVQTVLELKSLFRETLGENASHPRICAEVLTSSRMGIVDDAGADGIVCHQRFGLALLAQAALTPKVLEVYRDLLMYSDDTCEIYMLSSQDSCQHRDFPKGLWERRFEGQCFDAASALIRELSQPDNPMILLGLQRDSEIYLAPKKKMMLRRGDELIVLAWERPRLG